MNDLVALAERAAREAGALLLERFRRPASGVSTKRTNTDMVSDADRDAEKLVMKVIAEARPGDAFLGEESGDTAGSSGLLWVIDPLDGTTNFLYGIGQFCVSVACEDAQGALAAVVYDPVRDECFTAGRGAGAFRNGTPIRVSRLEAIATALVATGFSYLPDERALWIERIARVVPLVRDLRRGGSAALDLAWTAAGLVDVYAEVPCARWDRAAGVLLVAEAGGVVTTLPAIGPSGDGVVAGPPALHDALRELL